jgi:hypothetical protein
MKDLLIQSSEDYGEAFLYLCRQKRMGHGSNLYVLHTILKIFLINAQRRYCEIE